MAEDTTEHPHTLTLRINAGAEFVIAWLVNRTRNAFEWMDGERPDGSGVRLNAGAIRRKLAGQSVSLRGIWTLRSTGVPPNDVQEMHVIDDAIEFKVRALSADRCEVIVERPFGGADSYLVPVLESMAESYPECRPAIDQHLARTGEASPAVDQVQRESPADKGRYPTVAADARLAFIERARDREVAAMWNAGMKAKQIMARFDEFQNSRSIHTLISRYRKAQKSAIRPGR